MMNDPFGIKQRIDAFDQRHGNFVFLGPQPGALLFEDGAYRECNPYGVLREPPDDPYERAKVVVRYWTTKRDLTRDEFRQFKNEMANLAKAALNQSVPMAVPSEDETRTQLTRLKTKVINNQRKLDKALAEVEANTPSHLIEREAQNQRHRQAAQELLSTIQAVEI